MSKRLRQSINDHQFLCMFILTGNKVHRILHSNQAKQFADQALQRNGALSDP